MADRKIHTCVELHYLIDLLDAIKKMVIAQLITLATNNTNPLESSRDVQNTFGGIQNMKTYGIG